MQRRNIGSQGLETAAIGLGCMGMSHVYGPADESESIATIRRAIEQGVDLLDTADVYGLGANEALIGRAISGQRERVRVATKFGMRRDEAGRLIGIDGSPEWVRTACDASLKRLGVDVIDLWYLHRIDPQVPVEETVAAMADMVQAGKVRYLGLSEAGPDSLRRAHAVHPLSALQSEYSLLTRDPEEEILQVVRELGIGFVAYSPFGRGLLTGAIGSANDLAERDYRRAFPRYQGDNLDENLGVVRALGRLAATMGVSTAQLALAWLLHQGDDIVPIPGTKRRDRLNQNIAACDLQLDADMLTEISAVFPAGAAHGARFRASAMERVGR